MQGSLPNDCLAAWLPAASLTQLRLTELTARWLHACRASLCYSTVSKSEWQSVSPPSSIVSSATRGRLPSSACGTASVRQHHQQPSHDDPVFRCRRWPWPLLCVELGGVYQDRLETTVEKQYTNAMASATLNRELHRSPDWALLRRGAQTALYILFGPPFCLSRVCLGTHSIDFTGQSSSKGRASFVCV